MNRREFIGGSILCAASGASRPVLAEMPLEKGELVTSAPMLQVPAETTMGIVWAVGTMAKGEVEVSERPDMSGARVFRCGGYGVTVYDMWRNRVAGRHEFAPRKV